MSNIIYLECPTNNNEEEKNKLKKIISCWLESKELKALVNSFGGNVPVNMSLQELAKWYLEFSNIWDYRNQKKAHDKSTGENARWLVSQENLNEEQKKCINNASYALGLKANKDTYLSKYDYILVLGGAKLSCLLRTKMAFKLVETNTIQEPKAFYFLASSRPVADTERVATDTYAKDAVTEFDLMNESIINIFKVRNNYEQWEHYELNHNSCWKIRNFKHNLDSKIISISAPSLAPETRRANSADTYEFLFKKLNIEKNSKLLLVTGQIYVPYQQLEAIRTIALEKNVVIDTIGFPPEWGGDIQGMNHPTNYLQEIRSVIQSINRYLNLI